MPRFVVGVVDPDTFGLVDLWNLRRGFAQFDEKDLADYAAFAANRDSLFADGLEWS